MNKSNKGIDEMSTAKRGDWVQIKRTLLEAGQRAPQVPEDTSEVSLEMKVKGYLQDQSARIGDEVTIRTVIGRLHNGTLVSILPRYLHDFGLPIPELLDVADELRRRD